MFKTTSPLLYVVIAVAVIAVVAIVVIFIMKNKKKNIQQPMQPSTQPLNNIQQPNNTIVQPINSNIEPGYVMPVVAEQTVNNVPNEGQSNEQNMQ